MQDLRPTGSKPPADFQVGDFEKLHGTRDAIAVALALLDELLQIPPERPDRPSLKEVAEVLREIRDMQRRECARYGKPWLEPANDSVDAN
jgi:hypothetical protein